MPRRPRAETLVLFGALAAGCAEADDDLDSDVVNALAVTEGNALGFDRTGDYTASLTELECSGCVGLLELAPYSACALTAAGSIPATIAISALQTDGVLLLGYDGTATTGPLDADGAFAVGAVVDLSTPVSDGHAVMRIDGEFLPDAEPDRFDAEIRRRITGRAESNRIDCFERFALEAYKLQ